MKQKLLDALKAKFPGVSDAILDRVATKLAKTVTEESQVATAVEGVTFQQVLDSYGDSRATEAQQTAVRNYETKHNLKDGKPVEAPKPPEGGGGGGEEIPAWAKTLIDSNKTLTERLNKMDGDRLTTTRKQRLATIIERLPETLRKGYERMSVSDLTDEQFETLVTDVTGEVDAIATEAKARGAVFGKPSAPIGGGGNGAELTDAQKKAISQRTPAPADEQPF